MVTHMKTTIDLADALLIEAKQVAAQEGTTLRSVLEEALRRELDRRSKAPVPRDLHWIDPPLEERVEFPVGADAFQQAAYGDRG